MTAPNPLLVDWTTPFGLPPFDRLRAGHFPPAFEAAMRARRAEVEAIAANPAPPDFDNTVAAFDRSGKVAEGRVAGVHFLMKKNKITEIHGYGTFTGPKSISVKLNDGGTDNVTIVIVQCRNPDATIPVGADGLPQA